jgi:lysozyme
VNLPDLVKSLKAHEGFRTTVYTCTAGKPTIGVGHNLETPISDKAIAQILSDDIDNCIAELDRIRPSWRGHNDSRQNVLIEMMFNLGAPKLDKFARMWGFLDARDYERAAYEMLDSGWAIQVGQRAKTLSTRMRIG